MTGHRPTSGTPGGEEHPVDQRATSRPADESRPDRLSPEQLRARLRHAAELRAALFADLDRYSRAVEAVTSLHRGVGRRTTHICELDRAPYPCRTVLELNAAQGLAWRGENNWSPFTTAEAELSAASFRRSGHHWRDGIGRSP